MKKIYIVLTHTGTILSKIIKNYTKYEFSHVSIALDKDLNEMYSFGRLKPYNPFIAGFVHEHINKGTFKRFYNTRTKIYYLMITDEEYNCVKDTIEKIKAEKDNYKFNIIGLFAAGFHKKIGKEKSFYCAEFVKYVLENAKVNIDLPEIVTPEDFNKIKQAEEIYTGLLRKYKAQGLTTTKKVRNNIHINKYLIQKEE